MIGSILNQQTNCSVAVDTHRTGALLSDWKSALSQNAACGVSTRQKNPHLRAVNAGFLRGNAFGDPMTAVHWTVRPLPDTFCDSAKSGEDSALFSALSTLAALAAGQELAWR